MATGKLRVGVVYGGRSAEHSVSLESAAALLRNMDPAKYEVVPIGIDPGGSWHIGTGPELLAGSAGGPVLDVPDTAGPGSGSTTVARGSRFLADRFPCTGSGPRLDIVFPLIHGTFGEDGTLQGLLEMAGIPYVGSGVLGSALCMDKWTQKLAAAGAGIPVVPYLGFRREDYRHDPAGLEGRIAGDLGLPVFVKPSNSGSSRGIAKVKARSDLAGAIEDALRHDGRVVVERGISCREIEVSVLGNSAPNVSHVGEILPQREWYDFEAKYSEGGMRLEVPARIPDAVAARVHELARRSFDTFDCSGLARIDFFLERETDRLFLNEVNTIPGFTAQSVYSKLWEATGVGYADLVDALIELALDRHRTRSVDWMGLAS